MTDMLLTQGAQWFTGVAAIATLLFGLTVLLMLLGGDAGLDGGGDIDLPDGADAGDSAFKVLSFQGIVGFAMGWGWGGLVAFRSLEWSWPAAAGFGFFTGLCFLWMLWIGFKALHDLTGDGNVRPRDAVGLQGTVTIAIPESGSGRVRVVVGRRQREFRAVAGDSEIAARQDVRIVDVLDDGALRVEVR